jgi:hypothetical protein
VGDGLGRPDRMTSAEARMPRLASASVWLLPIAMPLAIGLMVLRGVTIEGDAWFLLVYVLIATTWGLTGSFLITRRPENRVGWLLWLVGAMIGIAMLGQVWAYLSLESFNGSLPGAVWGAMLGMLLNPALYLAMLIPLVFPDGRFLSRRWAALGAILIASAGGALLASLVRPGQPEGIQDYENPLGVTGLANVAETVIGVTGVVALVCLVGAVLGAVTRFRRGTPTERSQLKWFGSAVGMTFTMFFVAAVLPQPLGQGAWIMATISLGLIPIAIGIAIIRYRLYDIDQIVSRTIGWAIVTGTLVVIFTTVVVGLQALLAPWTENNTLAVAASTLVAAALFQPLRGRVQRGVDRRFNRSRVDAGRAVAGFADHARNEVDLTRLGTALVATANDAVHPSAGAVWLRGSAR